MMKIATFLKNNVVMCISFVVAVITMCFVPPNKEYLEYFDANTLICLFTTLAVVCAFKNINFFYILAQRIVQIFKTTRMCILALVYITFIGSMLLANDMALLTFLPLGYFVLHTTNKENYMVFTFIMQNIAANLGGCLTPFGNPQNLYLYSYFNISNVEFINIMLPTFIVSVGLITICCLCVKNETVKLMTEQKMLSKKSILYGVLFVLCILMVFRLVHSIVCLIVVPLTLFFVDKKALKDVDYPLLLTFIFFFIFAGNVSRIEFIKDFIEPLLQQNTLLFSSLSCQFISNVPSAILLSQFTNNYQDLLIGVNIGGTGTLIASLASLITFKEYMKHNQGKTLQYIGLFSIFNFGFLSILLVLNQFVF